MPTTNSSLNYKIAMTGVFSALSVVLALTPVGYIQIPGTFISITIMHIPAILAAITAGLGPGIAVGAVFGITSLIRTAMSGGANPFFVNPAVSVLPRMLFPIAAWAIFKAFNAIPKMPKVISGAFSAAIGTFVHTALVMFAIYAFYGSMLIEGMAQTFEKFGFAVDYISIIFRIHLAIRNSETYFGQGIKANFIESHTINPLIIMDCTFYTKGFFEIIAAVIICVVVLGSIYAVANRKSKITKLSEAEGDDDSSEK